MNRPSVYVLRRSSDPFPDDDRVSPGDFVILHSGDVTVWDGVFWHLLPGRSLSVEELKEFLGYVGSGWPTSPEDAQADLNGKLPEYFLSRMVKVCAKLHPDNEEKESGD
jgi:hypothetical protein